jgi:ubiquinone/menaquinone biosynthesis C-methylase UbiE
MTGLYRKFLFPRLLESSIGGADAAKERAKALEPAHGEVLEVGFGTGLNLPHYPRGVTRLVAVDPEEMLAQKVSERVAAAGFPVEVIRQGAERLPFETGRFDCVVTTWTLCSIGDPACALREMRRVLKPGGSYVFYEHGRSADPRVARLQDWVNPLWKLTGIGCGCSINRPIDSLIYQAGFRIVSLERYALGRPRIMQEMYRGVATHGETRAI